MSASFVPFAGDRPLVFADEALQSATQMTMTTLQLCDMAIVHWTAEAELQAIGNIVVMFQLRYLFASTFKRCTAEFVDQSVVW